MRIVIATPFYPPQIGVLSNYAHSLEEAFKKQGHDVAVVALGSLAQLPPGIRHAAYFIKILLAIRGVAFVLSLDMWSVGLPAYLAARLRGVRFLIRIGGDSLHESYVERTREPIRLSEFYSEARQLSLKEQFMKDWFAKILKRAHAVMFNTNFQKRIWDDAYGIPAGKSRVLENYYPVKSEYVAPMNRVFVGANRPAFFKNSRGMHVAFARVKARHPEIELDEKMLPHDLQLQRIATSYATIVPSISEVASNIAIESATHGRPFIMSEDTGIKERLEGCGLFIDTRSEVEIEKAIESLLDPEQYRALVERIRAFSYTHSWDDIAHEIIRAL